MTAIRPLIIGAAVLAASFGWSGRPLPAAEAGVASATAVDGANLRVATYRGEAGGYFAASVQPTADDALLAAVDVPADVVVVIDTSASQSGEFRTDSIRAARQVIDGLRSTDRVSVHAVDVGVTDLTSSFVTPADAVAALDAVERRLPMGNTNLIAALDRLRTGLVASDPNHSRSIVYIGDGSTIESASDDAMRRIVDALRADRITVHSVAIGPTVNIELLGILGHHTGGLVTAVGDDYPVDDVAGRIARGVRTSPVWITGDEYPAGLDVSSDRHPPLRLDRDAIVIGRLSETGDDGLGSEEMTFTWTGATPTSDVTIQTRGVLEDSHPDFGFLVGLVSLAERDGGVRQPTAGSSMMRFVARRSALRCRELIKAGKMAIEQGNRRGARAIVDEALRSDPDNEQAKKLSELIGQRLIVQNEGMDDIFGGDDPFADAADAPAGGATGGDAFGDDAFGGEGGDPFADPAPAPAAPRAAAPAPAPMQPAAPAFGGPNAPIISPPPTGDFDAFEGVREPAGPLLDDVLNQRSANEGRLRALVNAQLRESRRVLRSDPTGVAGSLKSLLSRVETMPDVRPELRRELASQVRSAIRVAAARESEYAGQQANLEQVAAAANASQRLLADRFRREASLQALSAQMNALIDEGRYIEADRPVAVEFSQLAGMEITKDSVEGHQFRDYPLMLQTYARDRRYRELRERNFVDAMSLVLKSNIPFVDEPPIMYPDADTWQRLSRRRLERYGAIELVGDSETERRIEQTLDEDTSVDYQDLPLGEVVRDISAKHDIPVIIDNLALSDAGLSEEEPITKTLNNVSLRSALRIMLRELDLTYMIKDEVMQITTRDVAEENLITKVYPVGDLVVPIIQLGGMGGGGGGMGGGMGGGGMGGGGMGGGMGGGGMGGGGMGGGGGMFAVPDRVTLDGRSAANQSDTIATPFAENPGEKDRQDASPRRLKVAGDTDNAADAWRQLIGQQSVDSAEQLARLDADLRQTVRYHSARAGRMNEAGDAAAARQQFETCRDVIGAAIHHGHVQPWMYEAYAIALRATDADAAEIERAYLSAADFTTDTDELLNIVGRLESIGSHRSAMDLCRRIAESEPDRREPIVVGMRISERTGRDADVRWAVTQVLGRAWPEAFEDLVTDARRRAKALHAESLAEGSIADADDLGESLKIATSHDVVVRVSWTGNADLDISVEEPAGTVCSAADPASPGGGTHLGDVYPDDNASSKLMSETYVCPTGFAGKYRLLIRRVWGDVSTGEATVEVLTDTGRETQTVVRRQIPVTETDALVVFECRDGKRQEAVADAQLEHLRDVRRDLQHQVVMGQFLGNGNANAQELFEELYGGLGTGGLGGSGGRGNPLNPFFRRGAVGFRPEITTLPEGASLSTLAVISADRRYVRISPAPFFSQIGAVTTFNFVSGEEGAGTGGGGGLGGGLGGGGFGGGGGGGGGAF